MLKAEQWQEKSESSLEASRILLENNKPVEAVSRAYYAAYQMVTGVLIKLNLSPRTELGNWSHQETVKMYRIHICQ
ncbi:MAG: HEPN domain-containing protein [bacterium]